MHFLPPSPPPLPPAPSAPARWTTVRYQTKRGEFGLGGGGDKLYKQVRCWLVSKNCSPEGILISSSSSTFFDPVISYGKYSKLSMCNISAFITLCLRILSLLRSPLQSVSSQSVCTWCTYAMHTQWSVY